MVWSCSVILSRLRSEMSVWVVSRGWWVLALAGKGGPCHRAVVVIVDIEWE